MESGLISELSMIRDPEVFKELSGVKKIDRFLLQDPAPDVYSQ